MEPAESERCFVNGSRGGPGRLSEVAKHMGLGPASGVDCAARGNTRCSTACAAGLGREVADGSCVIGLGSGPVCVTGLGSGASLGPAVR